MIILKINSKIIYQIHNKSFIKKTVMIIYFLTFNKKRFQIFIDFNLKINNIQILTIKQKI